MRRLLLYLAPAVVAVGLATVRAQTLPVGGTSFDVDLYGNVYVLDAGKNTLRLYDSGGTLLREVGGPGWADGQFDRPAAVWARNGIDVYVADFGNHRIERFDRSLNFVSSFSTRDNANPDERFGYPSSVALSRLGELFICDTENGQIVKVDRFSTVERTFGGITAGKGHLAAPVAVATGPNDAVYVLDGSRVAVYDAFGNYLRDLLPGVVTHPVGLFADDGAVAVLDSATIFFCNAEERPAGAFETRGAVPAGAAVRSFVLARNSLYLLTADEIIRVADPRHADGLENQSISH